MTSPQAYRICNYCIMDTSDPNIMFDEAGTCNHCRRYTERASRELHHGPEGEEKLKRLIEKIKKDGRRNPYDCIVGVSGGVDSTYIAYLSKKLGLRPLAVHFDNGWDTELAVSNIEKTLSALEIDLYTYVMDWEEFRDIQLAFLKASVINAEIPTDHAIGACLMQVAAKHDIRYLISGSNLETEAILPSSWTYDNRDFRHLYHVHKRFGHSRMRTFPHYRLDHFFYYFLLKRIRFVKLLNFFPYHKQKTIEILQRELGWVYYGGKHYESLFTRFFQGHYLPKKFGFDKRRAHLSTLICSGQNTRDEALEEMKKDPYPANLLKEDKEYVAKKFNLSEEEFEAILSAPPRQHQEFPSNAFIFSRNRFGLLDMAKKLATGV